MRVWSLCAGGVVNLSYSCNGVFLLDMEADSNCEQTVDEPQIRPAMQLGLGLGLQLVGCAFAATGLAFMKLSSERDGDWPMCLRWRWWLGFLFLAILATVVEGVVLTLVPLTIVAPFAGVVILISMLIAATGCISARVPLSACDGCGGVLTVIGIGLCSWFGPNDEQAEASLTFASVLRALGDPHFKLFVSATLLSVAVWLLVVLAPPLRSVRSLAEGANLSTPLSAYAAAVCGALSQNFLKCVSVAVGHSLSLDAPDAWLRDVWLQPLMWIALAGLALCAPLQLYLIDVCLASGAVTYAVPLYQALLVIIEIIAAAIFFRELESVSPNRLFGFGIGVAVATAGLVVLTHGEKARSRDPSPDPTRAKPQSRLGAEML